MIRLTQGNLVSALLDGDVDVMLHQANCQNVMGSGIAKEVRERIPEAFHADYFFHSWCKSEDTPQLGLWSRGDDVVNLYGQDFFNKREKGGRDTEYWALFKAMTDIKEHLVGKRVGIPKLMGCGLGGGDWNLVMHFIAAEYHDLDVHIYEYQPPTIKETTNETTNNLNDNPMVDSLYGDYRPRP